ncbi:hypothetical protein AGLY_012330, partial [Aphis glycines]
MLTFCKDSLKMKEFSDAIMKTFKTLNYSQKNDIKGLKIQVDQEFVHLLYVETDDLQQLKVYKFNQDRIELFFGSIRTRMGITIIQQSNYCFHNKNSSGCSFDPIDEENEQDVCKFIIDNDCIGSHTTYTFSNFAKQIIVYILGFILHKLTNTFKSLKIHSTEIRNSLDDHFVIFSWQ